MTDAPVAVLSNRPEYTAEQVEASVERIMRQMINGPLPDDDAYMVHIDPASFLNLRSDIQTVLSALSTAESEITRLTLQVESVEADTKRLDYLGKFGNVRAGHVFDASVDEWTGRFGWNDGAWWTHDADGDQTQYMQDNATLREAIDAARNQEGGNHG